MHTQLTCCHAPSLYMGHKNVNKRRAESLKNKINEMLMTDDDRFLKQELIRQLWKKECIYCQSKFTVERVSRERAVRDCTNNKKGRKLQ